MLDYFNTEIKPAAERLASLLDIDALECDHESTEEVEVDTLEFDTDCGRSAPTGTSKQTYCIKCGSWYNESEDSWETV